jgi:hypothetical protein
MLDHSNELSLRDCRLLKIGRHFRIGERTKVVIGRNEADNDLLEKAMQPGETAITWHDGNTPVGVVTGLQEPECLDLAARILMRYTKAEPGATCRVRIRCNGSERIATIINDMNDTAAGRYLLA